MEEFLDFQFNEFEKIESTDYTSPSSTEDYIEEYTKDGKKHYVCSFQNCGKNFRFKSEIMRHRVIHFGSRPFQCPYDGCNKSFKRTDALENHVRIHTRDLPYECGVPGCGLRFPTKAGLRYHLLKHTGERQYKCDVPGCDKSFLTLSQLKQHKKASSYHQKLSAIQHLDMPEEPVKLKKGLSKLEDPYYIDFFAPTPRPAQKIEWEVKNPEESEDVFASEDTTQDFEQMVKNILKENSMLKQKLDLCTKLMDIFQENQDLKSKLKQNTEEKPVEPFNYDENEYALLSFLKENDGSF